MAYKNNIFEVIKNIDKKNYKYYDTLSDEQKSEIQPYILTKWISSTYDKNSDEYYTITTNELINNKLFLLSEHKDLLFKLLCACGNGHYNKHKWLKEDKITEKKNKKKDFLKKVLGYKETEFELFFNNLSDDELENYLNKYGFEDNKVIRKD